MRYPRRRNGEGPDIHKGPLETTNPVQQWSNGRDGDRRVVVEGTGTERYRSYKKNIPVVRNLNLGWD